MKKIYSVALAAAVALSASAATFQLKQPDFKNVDKSNSLLPVKAEEKTSLSGVIGMKKLPQDDGTFTIEGDYKFYIGDYYFQDSTGDVVALDVAIADNGDGTITLSGDAVPQDVTAAYDAASGRITFTPIEYGKKTMGSETLYLKFVPSQYVLKTKEIEPIAAISAQFSSEDGTISFDELEAGDPNFGWEWFSDADYTAATGYYIDLYDVVELVPTEPFDEAEKGKWQSVGMATFVDAWILTGYKVDGAPAIPSEFPWEVELQQNVENQNIYRLWAPYWAPGCPVVAFNKSEYQGQIVFDVTDPDHVVVVAGIPSGFANSNGEIYCFNRLGWNIAAYGEYWNDAMFPDLIVAMENAGYTTFSTFKDNVITVEKSLFDKSPECKSAYTWNNASTYISTITFPEGNAVEGMSVENVPAKYYNLQGVEISNPEAGQVVIVRKGGKASKTIAK